MLEWYVYREDINNRVIVKFNVFNHWRFMEELKKAARKYRNRERDLFEERLRHILMYYYWSKCEWEIILSDWPPSPTFNDLKVDVFDQIMLNWRPFCDYVWAHKAELRRKDVDSEE